jgi:hypothetical protein
MLSLNVKAKSKNKDYIFIIKDQRLRNDVADGDISTSCEEVYNNMNLAMQTFNHRVFKNNTKSYYTDLDLKILNESRTTANIGLLNKVELSKINDKKKQEKTQKDIYNLIDKISSLVLDQIPVFDDVVNTWGPYCNEDIQDYNIYRVTYFNKNLKIMLDKFEFVHGFFLKQLNTKSFIIEQVRQPSSLRKDDDVFGSVRQLYLSCRNYVNKFNGSEVVNKLDKKEKIHNICSLVERKCTFIVDHRPIFNDVVNKWDPYNSEDIQDYHMYNVTYSFNDFKTTLDKYEYVHGFFLKLLKLNSYRILRVREPLFFY